MVFCQIGVCDMVFFKPAWMNKNEQKALEAVRNINKQSELETIVKEAPLWCVRVDAVRKINNVTVLKSIIDFCANNITDTTAFVTNKKSMLQAQNSDGYREVKSAAAQMLISIDGSNLLAYAKSGNDKTIRFYAIQALSDSKILFELAKDERDYSFRKTIIEKIDCDEYLAYFVQTDENMSVKIAAISRITDRTILLDTLNKEQDPYIRENLYRKLGDERNAAINRILWEESATINIHKELWLIHKDKEALAEIISANCLASRDAKEYLDQLK